jgi:TP901 family phage tail tape measure protein
VQQGAGQAKGALGGLQGTLAGVGETLTKRVTLPLVGVGVAAAKVAGDFEAQMATLSVAARGSSVSLETLREAALKTGADTSLVGISASESAEAIENLFKAGQDATDIFGDLNGYLDGTAELSGSLRAAIDLQAASELDLAQTSELVAITMATFGLEADDAGRIVDSFVQSADASVTSVSELGDAMVNVGPLANSLGWSLEDTNTALAILSERGIRGAEAGTNLKSMMLNLMKQTDPVTDALRELGVALFDAEGNMKSLPVILGELEGAMAGATQEQRSYYIQTLAGSYGQAAMNTLLGEGSAGWAEMEAGIASAATAADVAGARTDTFQGAMEALQGTIETLLIQAGTPLINDFLRPAVEWLSEVVGWFTALSPEVQQAAIKFGLLAAGMGPAIRIGSSLIGTFSGLAGGALKMGSALTAAPGLIRDVGAGFQLLRGGESVFAVASSGAAGLTATMIPLAAAVGAVYLTYKAWSEVQGKVAEGTAQVQDAWGNFFDEQVESGASASEVLEAYREKQALVREELDKGGVAADLLIRNQGDLINSDRDLALAVARTAENYEEFQEIMAQAGVESEISAETFEHLQAGTSALGQSMKGLTERVLAAGESYQEMGDDAAASDERMLAFASSGREAAAAARDVGTEVEVVVGAMMEVSDILGVTESAFAAVGLEGDALDTTMAGLEVSLGAVSAADAKLQSDVNLVAAAFAEGTLSAAAFNDYMGQAADGTLNLSNAQIAGISTAMEHAQAQREAAAAADEYRLALLSQSEALLDATAQQAAQIALQGLQSKFEDGLLSLDQYETAVISVQDTYGLATPQSRALAEAITVLNDGLASGAYAPEEYAAAVEAARAAAEGGEDSVAGLMTAVEEAVGPLGEGRDAVDEIGGSADAAAGNFDRLSESVGRARDDLNNLTADEWVVRVGTSGTLPPGVEPVHMAVGAWNVDQDTLAIVHQGEMVVPAAEAEILRGLISATPPPVFPAATGAGQIINDYRSYPPVNVYVDRVGDDVDVEVLAYRVAQRIQERMR